jgi:hypothetical protein
MARERKRRCDGHGTMAHGRAALGWLGEGEREEGKRGCGLVGWLGLLGRLNEGEREKGVRPGGPARGQMANGPGKEKKIETNFEFDFQL